MKRITLPLAVAAIGFVCLFILAASTKHCETCFSPQAMALKLIGCGAVVILGMAGFRHAYLENEKIALGIESLPLLDTDEAVEGVPFAGHGIIEAENGNLLNSPYTNTPCVYYHSVLEKYVKEGKNHNWRVIENNVKFVLFHISDERGSIDVDLANMDDDLSGHALDMGYGCKQEKSEIQVLPVLKESEFLEESVPKFFGLQVRNPGRFRKSEFVLKPGTSIFIYGMVGKNDDDGELIVRESKECPLIISTKTRDEYVKDFYKADILIYMFPLLMMASFTMMLYAVDYLLPFGRLVFAILLVLGNLMIFVGAAFSLYNRLIALKHRALSAQSDIEVELQRRADLIPNLVETVKGYSVQEKEIQAIVAAVRAGIVRFKSADGGSGVPVLRAILAVSEKYPNLKASENFRKLMRTLSDTESRIAYSREFYNRTVQRFNTLCSQFPYLLVSYPLKMEAMEFIAIGVNVAGAPEAVF
jgi:LemA protein